MSIEKTGFNRRGTSLNLIASLVAYGLSVLISFIISPYITKTLGVEANGFVGLANQFIGYISLITVALNSMASRFVSVHIIDDDYDKANRYFTSVVVANIFIGFVLLFPLGICSFYADKLFNVPQHLVTDAMLLFLLVSFNFIVGIVTNIFSVSTFAVNKLYLSSCRGIEGNLLRCLTLVLMYVFLPPKMYYVTLSVIVYTAYTVIWNIYYTKKLTPRLLIKKKYFSIKACVELIKSGAWNLLVQFNSILNTGLDLLLSNWFINPVAMGVLSVSKTLPTAVSTMTNTVSGSFGPEMTKYYAENDYDGFSDYIIKSIKILGMIINIPVVILIVIGIPFYQLWQPTLNATELYWLSLLATVGTLVSGSTACVFGMFTIVNRLKFHSITSLIFGVLNAGLVIGFLSISTNHGLYIIAGVSTLLIIVRNYFVTFPYAAKCLNQKWYIFHLASFRSILVALLASAISYLAIFAVPMTNWGMMIVGGCIVLVITVLVNGFVLFNKSERKTYLVALKKKLFKR